jgi:glycosyltransferase involved in cell wall biosynthesis
MRVGIYNRWLATLGGGEKHSLAIAEYLSQNHQVEVISHSPVSKDTAAERLHLNLSRVKFVIIPDRLPIEMTPVTAHYDFFICSSFMDYFPSRAPLSAMLVFFPAAVNTEPAIRLRRRLKLALRNWLMIPSFVEGVTNLLAGRNSQERWLNARTAIRIPVMNKQYTCVFDISSIVSDVHRAYIYLNNELVLIVSLLHEPGFRRIRLDIPSGKERHYHEITILADKKFAPEDQDIARLALTNFVINHPRYYIYRFLFEGFLKNYGLRMHNSLSGRCSILENVSTYTALWANSEFTQKWIRNYWDQPSEILTPPVSVEDFHLGVKKNWVLNVGRFFAGSHNKKHLVMISVFKKMIDDGLDGWEFHLAGGTTPGKVHKEYLENIKHAAKGYPIFIHTDIAFGDLVKLYSECSIYWHASGYGEDENRKPIRFEHFGLTTVEAMASGCVPVVINKGGQPEIVQHGKNGYMWSSVKELEKYTLDLVENQELRQRLSQAAWLESRKYDKTNFNARLQVLFDQVSGN